MNIKTVDIKEIFERIINKLEIENIKDIEIPFDLYFIIPTEKWDDMENKTIDTCSLYDDIEELKKMISSKDRPCTFVDFDRTSSLIRAISQICNPV